VRHGDFTPFNTVWRDGRVSGVIDWDVLSLAGRSRIWRTWPGTEFRYPAIGVRTSTASRRESTECAQMAELVRRELGDSGHRCIQ
jgi:hypothetical protein